MSLPEVLQRARTLALIPARFGATRFPGKPLVDLGGKPVVQHVYERTQRARGLDAVAVATDDERIAQAVRAFGGHVVMTADTHRSGTDRIAEVVASLPRAEIVLNIQGDEPFVEPRSVENLLGALDVQGGPEFATLREPLDERDLANRNAVKVVTDLHGYALYFSRAAIPFRSGAMPAGVYCHVGLYGFRREALLWFAATAPTPLEGSESLEQLRVLEHGRRMIVVESVGHTLAIDTPDDLERARARLQEAP